MKGLRENNDFCWINMLTRRLDDERRFFGELFGWTFEPMTGVRGWLIKANGAGIGGMFDCSHAPTPMEPMLGVAVKVASADDFYARAKELGGKPQPPMDVMDAGRMVVCNDPDGAQLDAWQPRKHQGTDVDTRAHGAPGWFQLMTRDADRAAKFYTGLYGWQARTVPEMSYTVFSTGKEDIGGMMAIQPQMGDAHPGWSTWITVGDVDAVARRAVELGGKLCVQLHDIPGVGRFCAATSPEGVPFHAIRWNS
jgi:predicted enzyme related to lactoylglutathione lyase